MASTEAPTPTTVAEKAPTPPPSVEAPLPPVTAKVAPPPATGRDFFKVGDLVLRALLFSTAVTALVVLVTSKQTKLIQLPIPPIFPVISRSAKFQHSPAFIYLLVALSVVGLYSIISGLVSLLALLKPTSSSVKILAHFLILDVLLLGILASATGASGGVAYIGLNGNSHVNWGKICNVFGRYCVHIGVSTLISLVASIVLALLVILAAFSLSKKIPR